MLRGIFALALGLACLPPPAEGRLEAGTVRLGGPEAASRWRALGSFAFAPGAGSYELRLRLRDSKARSASAHVDLEAFLGKDWGRAALLPPCRRALDVPAHKTHRLLEFGPPGEWGPWQGGPALQEGEPQAWHFALSSCSYLTPAFDIDYELRLRQPDGAELSAEMHHMPAASAFALVCLTAFFAVFLARCRRLQRRAGAMHPAVHVLTAALALRWAAQALQAAQLRAQEAQGAGPAGPELLAGLCAALSQVVSCTLLVALAQGHALGAEEEDLEPLRPLGLAVGTLYVVLAWLGEWQGCPQHWLREAGCIEGWPLLAARLLLAAWLALGAQGLGEAGGCRLQGLLRRLQLAGSVHFLALPVAFLFAQALVPQLRSPALQLGTLGMQTASAFWLAELFMSPEASAEPSDLRPSLLPLGSGGCCAAELSGER